MRAVNWCIWKLAMPAVLITALLPFYRFIMTLEHPFQRAFAQGDFILFAAILLFEVGVEAEWGSHQPRHLKVSSSLTKAVAALLMALYWVIKHDVIVKEEALARTSILASQQTILAKLSDYAWLSCGVGSVSLICAALLLIAVVDHQKREELREFGVAT
jgi:hypothetical protein